MVTYGPSWLIFICITLHANVANTVTYSLTLYIYSLYIFYCRFLHCSPLWGNDVAEIFNHDIGKHYHDRCEMEHTCPNDDKLISHLASLPSLSMKDQFTALSSISNFHWCDNPSLKSSATFQTKTTRISTHVVYPDEDRRLHLPTSPQNRLLYILTWEEYDMHIPRLV